MYNTASRLLASLLGISVMVVACPGNNGVGGEGEGESAEGEGEVVGEGEGEPVGEGEGEEVDPSADIIRGYCEQINSCDPSQGVPFCILTNTDGYQNILSVDHPVCSASGPAFLDYYACVSTRTCDQLFDPADEGCLAQAVAFNDLIGQGAFACFTGDTPVPPPAEWQCDAFAFNDGQGCEVQRTLIAMVLAPS
jgi:hypothetical protein